MKAILVGVVVAILAAPVLVGTGVIFSRRYDISWQGTVIFLSMLDVLVAYIVAGRMSRRG